MPSLSSITQRVFSAGTAQPLQLRGNSYRHELAVQDHWSKVRIVLLTSFPNYGTNGVCGRFWLGLCNNSRGVKSSNAAYVGWYAGSETSLSLTYNANSGAPYLSTSTLGIAIKTGTTYSTGTSGTPTQRYATADPVNPRRSISIWDITRGSPMNFQIWVCPIALMSYDMSYNDMITVAEQAAGTPVLRGSTFTTAANNLAYYTDSTTGYLNTLDIHWTSWLHPLEIYGIVVYQAY